MEANFICDLTPSHLSTSIFFFFSLLTKLHCPRLNLDSIKPNYFKPVLY